MKFCQLERIVVDRKLVLWTSYLWSHLKPCLTVATGKTCNKAGQSISQVTVIYRVLSCMRGGSNKEWLNPNILQTVFCPYHFIQNKKTLGNWCHLLSIYIGAKQKLGEQSWHLAHTRSESVMSKFQEQGCHGISRTKFHDLFMTFPWPTNNISVQWLVDSNPISIPPMKSFIDSNFHFEIGNRNCPITDLNGYNSVNHLSWSGLSYPLLRYFAFLGLSVLQQQNSYSMLQFSPKLETLSCMRLDSLISRLGGSLGNMG